MPYKFIQFERSEGVGIVTLNRPEKLNAFTPQMLEELLNVFRGMERDPEVRAIIVTGAGKAFCGGEDFKDRAEAEVQAEPAPPPAPSQPQYSYNPTPVDPPAPVANPVYSPLNPGPPPIFGDNNSFQNPQPVYAPVQAPVTPEYAPSYAPNAPATPPRLPSIAEQNRRNYNPLIRQIRRMEKPVIAAINGIAAGSGLGLALACDIRYASDRARFIEVSTRVGLMPNAGIGYFLPQIIGMSKAMELAFAGEELGAEQAEKLGLISKVIPSDNLLAETKKMAARLAKGPTRAIGLTKSLMYNAAIASLDQALDLEAKLLDETARTGDYKEGLKAFLEKRSPNFKGN